MHAAHCHKSSGATVERDSAGVVLQLRAVKIEGAAEPRRREDRQEGVKGAAQHPARSVGAKDTFKSDPMWTGAE